MGRKDLLCKRVTLPQCCPLTLKVLLGHRFALEQLLIEVGDNPYLAGRLAELHSEQHATAPTWQDLFGDQFPALLPDRVGHPRGQPAPIADEIEPTRQRLARLMHVKEYEDQYRQARGELKRRTAMLVTGVLSITVVSFAAAVALLVPDAKVPLAAAAAGATGAALGGLIKLRDQVSLGSQIRQFRPFFVGPSGHRRSRWAGHVFGAANRHHHDQRITRRRRHRAGLRSGILRGRLRRLARPASRGSRRT
jgi:hypothetical protein